MQDEFQSYQQSFYYLGSNISIILNSQIHTNEINKVTSFKQNPIFPPTQKHAPPYEPVDKLNFCKSKYGEKIKIRRKEK